VNEKTANYEPNMVVQAIQIWIESSKEDIEINKESISKLYSKGATLTEQNIEIRERQLGRKLDSFERDNEFLLAMGEVGAANKINTQIKFTPEINEFVQERYQKIIDDPKMSIFTKQGFTRALNTFLSNERLQPKQLEYIEIMLGKEVSNTLSNAYQIVDGYNSEKFGKIRKSLVIMSDAARTLQTIGDFSAMFRQGMGMVGEPKSFGKAAYHAFRALFSEQYMQEYTDQMKWDIVTKYGFANELYADRTGSNFISSLDGQLSDREELIASKYIEKIPIYGRFIVKPSERHYTMFLNKLRYDVFMQYAEKLDNVGIKYTPDSYENFSIKMKEKGEKPTKKKYNEYVKNQLKLKKKMGVTPEMYMELMHGISVLTGRGSFGKYKDKASDLNTFLYASRLLISYPQRLTQTYGLWRGKNSQQAGSQIVARMMTRNLIASSMLSMTLLMMARIAFGPGAVETDPRSVYFGKIRIGKSTIDVLGGWGPNVRLVSQISSDVLSRMPIIEEFIEGGKVTTSTGRVVDINIKDTVETFIRGKLAPLPGFGYTLYTGKDFIGRETSFEKEFVWDNAIGLFLPMTFMSGVEAQQEYKELWKTIALLIPEMIGMNVTTWDNRYWDEYRYSLGLVTGPYIEDYYTTEQYWTVLLDVFRGQTIDDIGASDIGRHNFDSLDMFFVESKEIYDEYYDRYVADALKDINTDGAKGKTYKDLYDEGIIPQSEYNLLDSYVRASETRKEEMLKEYPILSMKGSEKDKLWLKEHPVENAKLAFWGKTGIYSKTAYDLMMGYLEEFDLPKTAIPKNNMPPERFVPAFFDLIKLQEDYSSSSIQVRQLLLENPPEFAEWAGLSYPDDAKEVLDLRVKYAEGLDYISDLSDRTSDAYIEDEDRRKEAKIDYFTKNDDVYEAYIYKEKFGKGFEHLDKENVDMYVEFYKLNYLATELGAETREESLLILAQNPEFHQWALDNGLTTGFTDITDVKIPQYYELDIELREQDKEFELVGKGLDDTLKRKARQTYMANNREYARMYFAREAYGELVPLGFDTQQINAYVNWKVQDYHPDGWKKDYLDFYNYVDEEGKMVNEGRPQYADDWFLLDNYRFYVAMTELHDIDPSKGMVRRDKLFKTPSKEMWNLIMEYWMLPPGKKRSHLRDKHRELDNYFHWLHNDVGKSHEFPTYKGR